MIARLGWRHVRSWIGRKPPTPYADNRREGPKRDIRRAGRVEVLASCNVMMKHLAIAFVVLLAAASARGDDYSPFYGDELDCGYCVPVELDRLAILLGDEVLRDMVCRLSSINYTFSALSSAFGVPEGQVIRRINVLRSWRLVRTVRRDSAHTIVEPVPGEGGQTLRRWASRYCPIGDACGRGVVSPDGHRGRAKDRSVGGIGTASLVSGEAGLRDKLVTIFGGSGFLDRYLVNRLVSAGILVRVAVRNPDSAAFLRQLGDAGRIELMAVDVHDDARVEEAVAGAYAVVNLIGIRYEPMQQKLPAVHVDGARRIAEAAAAAKVERLVHVSSISADAKSRSLFARTKAASETAAREEFPTVTIVRPSIIFGFGDDFFNRFAGLQAFLSTPEVAHREILFQPVYAGDVSAAVTRILGDSGSNAQIYELGGPETMSLQRLFSFVKKEKPLSPFRSAMWMAEVEATVLDQEPKLVWRTAKPSDPTRIPDPLSRNSKDIKWLKRDHVVDPKALGLADLGITPTPVEAVVPGYNGRDRRGNMFEPKY